MSKAMTAASKEQLIELMQYLSQNISVPTIGIGGGFAPIGTIISYMGTTAPQDYLICDGTTYNIADYKQLSDFFAAQFGSANFFGGDGVTTFKVPDLRGEFLRGSGTNSHTNQGSGANVGVHQDATESPIVGAWFTANSNKVLFFSELSKEYDQNTGAAKLLKSDSTINHTGGTRYTYNSTEVTVANYPTETADAYTSRPTNTSVLYCIKVVAAGDVYSTTERVVGTWIDGKPVYEKTIDCGALPNATSKEVLHNITNLNKIVSMYGFCDNGSTFMPLPYVHDQNVANQVGIICNTTKVILLSRGANMSDYNGYVTIRYTKTTD